MKGQKKSEIQEEGLWATWAVPPSHSLDPVSNAGMRTCPIVSKEWKVLELSKEHMGHNIHIKAGIKSKLLKESCRMGRSEQQSVSLGFLPGMECLSVVVENSSVDLRASAGVWQLGEIFFSNADAHLIGWGWGDRVRDKDVLLGDRRGKAAGVTLVKKIKGTLSGS